MAVLSGSREVSCLFAPAGDTEAVLFPLMAFLAVVGRSRWWRQVRPVRSRMPEPERAVTDAAVN